MGSGTYKALVEAANDGDDLAAMALADKLEDEGRTGDATDVREVVAVHLDEEDKPHVRWMLRQDWQFGGGKEACPLLDDESMLCMLKNMNAIGQVATKGTTADGRFEQVVGLLVYALHEDTLEVLVLCVHPEHRTAGGMQELMRKLISNCGPGQRRTHSFRTDRTVTNLCDEWWELHPVVRYHAENEGEV